MRITFSWGSRICWSLDIRFKCHRRIDQFQWENVHHRTQNAQPSPPELTGVGWVWTSTVSRISKNQGILDCHLATHHSVKLSPGDYGLIVFVGEYSLSDPERATEPPGSLRGVDYQPQIEAVCRPRRRNRHAMPALIHVR